MQHELTDRVAVHLASIVRLAPHRPPGSPANRRATDYASAVLEAAGLPVTPLPFSARWWSPGEAAVRVADAWIPIEPPPFCGPATVRGRLRPVTDEASLAAAAEATREILVLSGAMAEPLLPKAFPFLSLPDQQARIAALEAIRPAAVLAVVPDDRAHEPVFEDPDLAFPYATIPASLAGRLLPGAEVELEVTGALASGEGVNLSAGVTSGRRAVVCAHLDSKVTTPGALDNGGGVAALLALAESGLDSLGPVELVLFNGEDHVDAPGEQAWLAAGGLDGVDLVINVDGAGLCGYPTVLSAIGGTPGLEAILADALLASPGVTRGEPWFESDHAVFAMRGIAALAITSGAPFELLKRRAHAPDDPLEDMDPGRLAEVIGLIRAVLARWDADR